MDPYEATQLVFARVQALEPENVSKIIGFLLLQERSEQEMSRLALGTDSLLQSAIAKAKRELGIEQAGGRPPALHIPDNQFYPHYPDEFDIMNGFPQIPTNPTKRHLQMHDLLACKPCLYYSRGFCKHGASCKFLHGSPPPQCLSPTDHFPCGGSSSPSSSSSGSSCSSSLERLEMELQDLLRGRRAPISIASLPQLYFERFGKALQAQGYLTESQRHGKSGCSLTKLLARLKGSVALIDRPHGQHAVVLAEDAHRYVGCYRADRDDLKEASPSSRQIYLTFPAESTFTEEDVSAHFRAYGPVQDVRIPYQQKRMFGFVTFLYMETVRTILSEGNPHYICGARVLVKPYREKARIGERKQVEKPDPMRGPPQFRSLNGKDFMQEPSFYDAFARRYEEERVIEMERRRILDMHTLRARAAEVEAAKLLMDEQERNGIHGESPEIPGTPQISEHNNNHLLNESTLTSEDMQQFQSSNPFGFVMDVLDSENCEESDINDCKVQVDIKNDLPESPFDEKPGASSLQEKMLGMNLNDVLFPNNDIICCICLQHCVEPSKLECNHTFCVQCILKVIRGSKDECPICRQHIGSQVYKILQNRDLQSWLSPTLSHRVAQHIW